MKKALYIVSFGDSSNYRLTADQDSLDKLEGDIKSYLEEKYPELSALKFYDKMTLKKVEEKDASKYAGYPEFNAESIKDIEKTLSTEVDDAADVSKLNSNAPWNP